MGPKKLLQLDFYFVVLLLCSFVCAKPAPAIFRDEKIEKQQELVGKIVDLIKREQIRMNLIEDDNKAKILNEKSVREEIENMIDENSIEEVSEAVELVDDALKHEPIFDDALSKVELGDFNSKQGVKQDLQSLEEEEEEDTSMEDIAIGIYQALPSDMQEGIRDTYEWGNEYYANVTKDLALEWYYFQLNANEVVDTYLGPLLDPEEEEEDEYSGYKPTIEKNDDYNDGILRPGESTVTMFDVVQEFFTDLWDNWFGERSSSNWNYLRILKKRSLQQKKQVNKRDIVLPSFGIAGEIVNDMANSAINAATVWKYQSEGPECPQRLLCQANQDIFSRGHVIPSVMTYLSNLVMSIMVENTKTSEMLLAAQHGRKGQVDCLKTYSKCQMKL